MSILQLDGFESETGFSAFYGQGTTNGDNGTMLTLESSTKRSGSNCIKLGRVSTYGQQPATYQVYRDFVADQSQQIVGVGLRQSWNSISTPNLDLFSLGTTDGKYVTFSQRLSDSKLIVKNVDGSTIGVSNGPLGANTQYYFQVKLVTHSSNGSIKVKIGNNVEIDVTGINIPTLNYKIGRIIFYYRSEYYSEQNRFLFIDDLYILDSTAPLNDFLGICSVIGSRPSADGDVTDFNASTGSRYTCIDELSVDSGDYVYSDNTDEKYLANMMDISNAGTIKGVRIHDVVNRSDVGSGMSKYKNVYRDVSDNEQETIEYWVAGTTQQQRIQFLETHPSSDAQTNTNFNDMQIGQKTTRIE